MSNDRSSRLRERRKEQRERIESDKADEPDEPPEESKESEPSKTPESSEPDKLPVKEEQVGVYMYLPESQADELNDTWKDMKYFYEKEFGVELEKNRHFYPLVVQYGLDGFDASDASDVKEKLDGPGEK